VRFRYHGTAEAAAALDEVTLRFAAQQTTALVGPSGGGKSTLIDLLPRLRVPDSGEILFDGVPAEMFDLASLRRAIAYAPQAPQIFDGTMAAHIGYGRADADMDDIRAAAKLAGADEFIEALPDGYDTQVGESGLRLSGGQRQRLDLARALVKRAPILILDEPTSNLDAASEELFRRSLRRIRDETDITIIIIGHRLSTVRHADCIVVLRDGRVLDSGSHEDLLARPGWYEEAYAKQHGSGARQQARLQAG